MIHITVIIQNRYAFDSDVVTGRQIRETATIPAGFSLSRRVQGGNEPIHDDEPVELRDGDHSSRDHLRMFHDREGVRALSRHRRTGTTRRETAAPDDGAADRRLERRQAVQVRPKAAQSGVECSFRGSSTPSSRAEPAGTHRRRATARIARLRCPRRTSSGSRRRGPGTNAQPHVQPAGGWPRAVRRRSRRTRRRRPGPGWPARDTRIHP